MFGEFEEPGLIDRYESVNCQRGVRAHRGARSAGVYGPVGKHNVRCVEVVDVGQGSSVDAGNLC